MTLSRQEAFARIRLLRSPHVGPVSYRQLLARFGTAQEAIDAFPELARRGGRDNRPADPERIEREIAAVRRAKARYVFHDSPDYPALLAQLDSAPPILTVRGDLALAGRPCVAIVGARNASAGAMRLAFEFAHALSQAGFSVVSGLARGVDGAAHRGTAGRTIGVIASGIDVAYPPEHAELQEQIAQEGLLVAEQPVGTEPRGSHFPSRNRIIAGLSAGTVVVEAAPRSGSLITARLAGEAGREVMAIPGSPLDARSTGCNQLIREGAILVQSPQDVVELLSDFAGHPRGAVREAAWPIDLSQERAEEPASVADMLSTAPVAVDDLVRQCGKEPSAVQLALLELEIAGRLSRHAGGRVSLCA